MPPKKKQKSDPKPAGLAQEIYGSIHELTSAVFCFVDENVNTQHINNELFRLYIEDQLRKRIVAHKEVFEIKLFGRNVKIQLQEVSDLSDTEIAEGNPGFLVTSQTQILLDTLENFSLPPKSKETSQNPDPINAPEVIEYDSRPFTELSKIFAYQESLRTGPNCGSETGQKNLELQKIRGLQLLGSSGSGKTFLVRRLVSSFPQLKILNCSLKNTEKLEPADILQKFSTLTSETQKSSYDILILDDISCSQPKHNPSPSTTILTLALESLFRTLPQTLILGITPSTSTIDPALLSINLFEKQVYMDTPSPSARCTIISKVISNYTSDQSIKFNLNSEEVISLGQKMSGFSVADIIRLFREAFIQSKVGGEAENPSGQKNPGKVRCIDLGLLREGLVNVQPAQLGEILVEMPKVYWKDIGGYEEVKKTVKNVVELPLLRPEIFKKKGVSPSKGILFYGPPGCSKTLMAKAIATEGYFNFLSVKGPEIFSKYVGDSEKAIRDIFRKARLSAPCVIFFDEIDAIASKRGKTTDVTDRVLIQLLTEMDGFEGLKDILILGATNRPDSLDSALIRPGRFDELVHISMPDVDARQKIVEIAVQSMPLGPDVVLTKISEQTSGYTGAEIVNVCREAGLNSIKRDIESDTVDWIDFEAAVAKNRPRVTQEMINAYKNFESNRKSLFG